MTRDEMWNAVAINDASYDGRFFYAVKTTGVYSRPSCLSKLPNLENVLFFDTNEDAVLAGFRPCKRCRPDLIQYQPVQDLAVKMRRIIDRGFLDKAGVFEDLKRLGVTPKRAIQVFKEAFGLAPGAYADNLRIQDAVRQLRDTAVPIIEIAYSLGFESLTAFYAFFQKHQGITPGDFRKSIGEENQSGASFLHHTTVGNILITADEDAVTGIRFAKPHEVEGGDGNALTCLAAKEIDAYLTGKQTQFTTPLKPIGSAFQMQVWAALQQIPYGQTRSYKQVSEMIGRPSCSRAVGMANNRNPLLIMIPCHRVVGSDGALTGYAGGLDVKQRLLELEAGYINSIPSSHLA